MGVPAQAFAETLGPIFCHFVSAKNPAGLKMICIYIYVIVCIYDYIYIPRDPGSPSENGNGT